jgi:hypothetical protein
MKRGRRWSWSSDGRPCWDAVPSDMGDLACLRDAGHLGKHIPLARDAGYADRYPNTNGYRRQRRRHGWKPWPSRKRAGHLRLAQAAFSMLAGTPEVWP